MVTMGFTAVARHRSRAVTAWRQGDVVYLTNAEPGSYAARFLAEHGPCAVGMGWRMVDPEFAHARALSLGAEAAPRDRGALALDAPAIAGIGGSVIYFLPQVGNTQDGDGLLAEFEPIPGADQAPAGVGLAYIDHLTHNVHKGRMKEWADFYERLFNFREVRYFDIEGQVTGVKSKAMTSPCGKIRIPINEEGTEKAGQIQEYLDQYRGEGIQHVALGSTDLMRTVDAMKAGGVKLLDTIDTYYDLIDKRIPGHGEDVGELRKRRILIDGKAGALLLQIFSENQLGPIFFEFIQRKGDDGFGEGNFKALFESIELDQVRRGVLKPTV
jgi:4-hydroxyphenylpyruvate dioxygenase